MSFALSRRESKAEKNADAAHTRDESAGHNANWAAFALGPVQAKLRRSAPGDASEIEADRVADELVRGTGAVRQPTAQAGGMVQRKCATCGEEECKGDCGGKVQAKAKDSGGPSTAGGNVMNLGGGRALPKATAQDFGRRLNTDLSGVRLHTDARAAGMAESINARAFTAGRDIVFNKGEYAPDSSAGKHLLAHELAHVLQQDHNGPALQRDPKEEEEKLKKEAAALEAEILANDVFKKLKAEPKARALRIIAKAKAQPLGAAKGQQNYYLSKLKIAITTPFNGTESGGTEYGCSSDIEDANKKEVDEAITAEDANWGGFLADVEEQVVAGGTNTTVRTGEGGKKFTVDRSDPRDIRVKVKIKLNGTADEVAKIKKLEDAIERDSATKGYTLDIEFVDVAGPDVFEMKVKFCEWANSGNWASGPTTLSHEVHHALGLPDRYNYIESHADNEGMNVPMRLLWFEEQMNKKEGARDPFSKMDTSSNPLLAEDVCAVAFDAGAARDKCIQDRKDLDDAKVPAI